MPHCLRFILPIFVTLLAACAFDDDISRIPGTEATFLLVENFDTNEKEIIKEADGQLSYQWQNNIGIGGAEISDMTSGENQWWLASASESKIYRVNPNTEMIEAEISIAPVRPHFMSIGYDHILIADTTNQTLSFFNLDSEKIFTDTIYAISGKPVFKSGKFYLRANDTRVQIYLDQARTLLNELIFDEPVFDIQADNRTSIYVYSSNQMEIFETEIYYHSDEISGAKTTVNFTKIRYSPFRDRPLGKELLSSVLQINGKLNYVPRPDASDFEVDFLEGWIYYQANDSLYRMNVSDRRIFTLGFLRGQFQESYFYVR